jgi:uncharacterized protein YgiM (DUF1202 family)
MSDRYRTEPPDEPIIGGTYPTQRYYPEADEPVIGGDYSPVRYAHPEPATPTWESEYDDPDEYEDDGYYDEEYDGYRDDDAVARQPIFYVVLVGGLLVAAAIIAIVVALVGGGDGENVLAPDFSVSIDAPGPNDRRIAAGTTLEVAVRATSSNSIARFGLYVGNSEVDHLELRDSQPGVIERATLKATFERRGEYDIFVRVTSATGATKDSDKVRIVVTEQVGDVPTTIKGRIVAAVNARTGPGDSYEVVGSLPGGEEVTIKGRTRSSDWLLIDSTAGNNVWVRRSAVEPMDSITLVPIREPTPTPRPQPTNTPEPSPTASPSATPDASLPDFLPIGAVLMDAGARLRVTVQNNGGSAYSGPLVVSVTIPGVAGTPTLAFNVTIPAKGATTVEFDLTPAVTSATTATVRVDPDGAVPEAAEDNNVATFSITPPSAQPNLSIVLPVTVSGTTVTVQLRNTGGPLATTQVTVRVTVGNSHSEITQEVALATNQTVPLSVQTQLTGPATVTVTVGSIVLTADVTIPGGNGNATATSTPTEPT